MKNTMTFDSGVAPLILESMGFHADKDGNILNEDGTLAKDIFGGCPVHVDKFAGVIKMKCGIRIITPDLPSLIEVADRTADDETPDKYDFKTDEYQEAPEGDGSDESSPWAQAMRSSES